jgi:multiple sugar transport system permease protein
VKRALAVLTGIGLLVFLLVILVPVGWIASMSFKTYEQIQFATSIYVPQPFTWENYTGLWTETRFPLWLRNSMVTAVVVTIITTIVASLAGYAVARIRFPGRESVASLILILYLIPPALLFIPLYRVLAELGTTNHLTSLFLSYPTFTVPFCTWLLIGFFKALPDELEEAALIDGAGRATAFFRVLLSLAAPGLVASAIFAFTLSWNEFLYALVFIQDETMLTVPVGLNLLIYGDVFHWGQLMAASVITTLPVVALYIFIHRWMVEGLVAGSVKG